MAKIYNIQDQKSSVSECRPFENANKEEINEYSATYMEVLKIFKGVFNLIDINKILKGL